MTDTPVFSKYTIFSKIRDSENFFLVNLLTGNADILPPDKAREITERRYTDTEEYLRKGYLVHPEEEKKLFNRKYLDFLDARANDEIQLFFVPWYHCNFSCSYCYQSGYARHDEKLSTDTIDAFFSFIGHEFAGRRKYITLFGGEPLMPDVLSRERIGYLIEQAERRSLGVAVVTNGYTLTEYMPLFEKAFIREIQVTLDGPEKMHNLRRPLKNGGETFARISEGIDAALARDITVNLRVVLDRENISALPELAAFAVEKKWTEHPRFKTQLGRNYELHFCQGNRNRLFERAGMYEELYRMARENPEILRFHRPAFSITRFLAETGTLPEALFDSCPGCKTEWAFDHTGKIFPCTATVGKDGREIGTFYPTVTKNTAAIGNWQDRDVTAIAACRDCALQLACGGGCAAVAENTAGSILAPDCRPVKELIEMGMSLYCIVGSKQIPCFIV